MTRTRVLLSTPAALALVAAAVLPAHAAAAATTSAPASRTKPVLVRDYCDPASFNAALQQHVCDSHAGVTTTFPDFIGELQAKGRADGWAFTPSRPYAVVGDVLRLQGKGGEFHSFTPVAHFGGGCVPELNALLGLTPVPECTQTVVVDGKKVPKIIATGIVPGQTVDVPVDATGTHRYQCLIHPWMHAVVQVRSTR